MKASEYREMSVEDLMKELTERLKELFNLGIQKGMGQAPKRQQLRGAKKAVAQIKTILNEKGSKV